MRLQAHSVSEAMIEGLFHTRVFKNFQGLRVNLCARHARAHDFHCVFLGFAHKGKRSGKDRGRLFPYPECPGLIRTIIHCPAAHIYQQRRAGRYDIRSGNGMRLGRVAACCHNISKSQILGAVFPEKFFYLPAQILLG